MNIIKRYLSLLFLLGVFQLCGFAQIKVVDDDYKPNLGGLEELKLEDLASELDFDFTVGDSVYVLESTHKSLCFNKNTHKVSVKPFNTGPYVITGICFGDSIDRLHTMVDQYVFDKEYDRQEAHIKIYSFRIKRERWEDHFLFGDTLKYGKSYRESLVSFYQSLAGKDYIQEMTDGIANLKSGKKNDKDSRFTISTVVYRFENEEGDMFYIDQREIKVRELVRGSYYNYQRAVYVLKSSYYSMIAKDLVGKDFYLYNGSNRSWEEIDRMKTKDYLTQKEININLAGGEKFELALSNQYDDIGAFYKYNSVEAFGLDNYYRCKDLVMKNSDFVVILGNEVGDFSAPLTSVSTEYLDYYDDKRLYSIDYDEGDGYGYGYRISSGIDLVSKKSIDRRLQEWRAFEKEKGAKRKKAEQERIAKQKKHNADIIAKYGEKYGKMILQHKVAIGMSKEMCREAGWYPRDTYRTTTSRGVSEIWVINYKTALYFADGILYMIEN